MRYILLFLLLASTSFIPSFVQPKVYTTSPIYITENAEGEIRIPLVQDSILVIIPLKVEIKCDTTPYKYHRL